MKIIEIQALSNGAHRNQGGDFSTIPDGWAIIPDGMTIPDTFPFVDIEVEEVTYYRNKEVMQDDELVTVKEPFTAMTVTSMTAGVVPEPAPEPEAQPSEEDDTAALLIDHEYRLTLLELGLHE